MDDIAGYIEHLKNRDIDKAKKCEFCDNPAVGINSNGYEIAFVCDDHYLD